MWQSGFSPSTVVSLALRLAKATGATSGAKAREGPERREAPRSRAGAGTWRWVGVEGTGGWVLAAVARRPPESVIAVPSSAPGRGHYERRKPVCPFLSAIFV